MNGELIDGLERNRRAPATFQIPTDDMKASIQVGDHVKIGAMPTIPGPFEAEKFWVRVTAIPEPGRFEGVVRNDLTMTANHGLRCDDPVEFESRHILTVE